MKMTRRIARTHPIAPPSRFRVYRSLRRSGHTFLASLRIAFAGAIFKARSTR